MIKRILFTLLLFTLTLTAKESVETRLRERLKSYKDIKNLQVTFTQKKHLKELDVDIDSKGEMTIRPPDFLSWKLLAPTIMSVTMTNNTLTLTSQNRDGKEQVTTLSLKDQLSEKTHQNLIHLTKWMKMDQDFIIDNYFIEELEKNRYLFRAKKSQEVPFLSLSVTLKDKGELSTLTLTEKNGDELILTFGKPKISL